MRTLFRWLVVTLGIAALVRWLRRRGERTAPVEAPAAPSPLEDPADELRRKLAESRGAGDTVEQPAVPEESVDERRAEIHAQGRSTLTEMKAPDED